jgi:hypothetical protein
MSNTLRRKMFKLGGEVSKSHGVGLTHGLKFNKGGNVQASYGVGNNANKKVGPDGQVREAHNLFLQAGKGILGMVAPGARQLYNAVRGGGIKGIDKYIRGNSRKYGPDKVLETAKFKPRSSGPVTVPTYRTLDDGTRVVINKVAGKIDDGGRELITKVGRGDRLNLTKKAMLGRLARGVGIGTVPIGGPLAAGALLNTNENSPRALQMLEAGGKFAADISPVGLGYMAGDYLFTRPEDYEFETLTGRDGIFGGDKKEEVKIEKGPASTEIDNYENMKSDAEKNAEMMYKAMGGGANFDSTLVSNALLQAAPFVAKGEYAEALAAAGDVVNTEVAADKELQQQISGTIIEQEIAGNMADDDMIRKMVAEGDYENAFEARRALQASDQTDDVAMAIYDNKDQLDVETMVVGKVYTDVKNASGDLFVVKNSSGQVQSFNRYQDALAYSET